MKMGRRWLSRVMGLDHMLVVGSWMLAARMGAVRCWMGTLARFESDGRRRRGGAACRRRWVGGRCSGRRWAALDGDEEATMGAASSGSEKKVRLARAETTPLDAGGGAAASVADGAGGSLAVADLAEEDDGGRSSSRSWLPCWIWICALSPSLWAAWIVHLHHRRRARRRQPWLPALMRVMEHRVWCSGGAP
ncbi:hypothetical protein ACLOJK_004289 [Asimina triloba]